MSRLDPYADIRVPQMDARIGASFAPGEPNPSAPSPTGGAPADPFSMFNDPATNYLTQTIKSQIAGLNSAPLYDPTTAGLMAFLGRTMGSLSKAAPISFNASNPLLGDFITEGRQRIAELNQAPFTAAQETALKARTRNDLATQRDQAKQRLMEDAARRGLGESSGIIGQEVANLEGQTTAQDAKNQNDLMLWIADQAQQRKNQAASIAQSLAGAGQAQAEMEMRAAEASNNANMARQGMVLNLAGTLAQMAAQARGEARANRQDVLQMATMLSELPVQRLQLAMGVLNGSGGNNIPNIFNDVMSLNNAQANAQTQADQQQAAWVNALSQWASYIANKTGHA